MKADGSIFEFDEVAKALKTDHSVAGTYDVNCISKARKFLSSIEIFVR